MGNSLCGGPNSGWLYRYLFFLALDLLYQRTGCTRLSCRDRPFSQKAHGEENDFKGVVDLVKNQAIVWHDATQGATFDIVPIPDDMLEEATMYREKLLEAVAEFDESLMEKYFEDPTSITEDEILAALRAATISMKIVPMLCGSSFKNKGVQTMLDYVMELLPSPMDVEGIIGHHPETDEEILRKSMSLNLGTVLGDMRK